MILAGKAYYDGVAKIGEIATGSPVSTELGELIVIIRKPGWRSGFGALPPASADRSA